MAVFADRQLLNAFYKLARMEADARHVPTWCIRKFLLCAAERSFLNVTAIPLDALLVQRGTCTDAQPRHASLEQRRWVPPIWAMLLVL